MASMTEEQRRLAIAHGWQVGQDLRWVLPATDFEHNSDHPRPPGQPATPAGTDGLSQWSGERSGAPNRNIRAEIEALEAQLAATRMPVTRPDMAPTTSNVYVDPNVEPYEYTIQKECSADRKTAAGW